MGFSSQGDALCNRVAPYPIACAHFGARWYNPSGSESVLLFVCHGLTPAVSEILPLRGKVCTIHCYPKPYLESIVYDLMS